MMTRQMLSLAKWMFPPTPLCMSVHVLRTSNPICLGYLLLLASCTSLLLALAGDDLAKHDNTVAIHEGYPGQTLTILEGVAHQRLLGSKTALCHLVGLERVRVLHL